MGDTMHNANGDGLGEEEEGNIQARTLIAERAGFKALDQSKSRNLGHGASMLTLLFANANQLRFVVEHEETPMRTVNTWLLSISIFLQVRT